jgi:putative iron-dependent peroxidase
MRAWSLTSSMRRTSRNSPLQSPPFVSPEQGVPGAAGSVLLLQKWKHKSIEWEALPERKQEQIMGRTKLDSIELENKPQDSHVARTDQDKFGNIFRRNIPYGNVADHGAVSWIQRGAGAAFEDAG